MTYRFSGFRVDAVRRLLFGADGAPIPLKPRVFDTLLYLVEHRDELLDKRTLLEAIWPNVVVEENNLNQAISTLRRVFCETRDEHRFIVTEPGRGYRFVASVEPASSVTTEPSTVRAEAAAPMATSGSVPATPVTSPAAMRESLGAAAATRTASRRRPLILVSAAIAATCALAAMGVYRLAAVRTESADSAPRATLPNVPTIAAIEEDIARGDWEAGFAGASAYASANPGDSALDEVWPRLSWITRIPSDPTGATVYRRPYNAADQDWVKLGTTPIERVRIPFGLSLLRYELDGHRPVIFAIGGGIFVDTELRVVEDVNTAYDLNPHVVKLDSERVLPEDMVRVPGWAEAVDGETKQFRDFFLKRFEVTNREFQTFVDGGGYRRRDFWQHPFVVAGKEVSWEEAMALLVDKTGRPGPSMWEAGHYPTGQEDYPVGGVSWYEAAAYALSVGRVLPTIYHWRRAVAAGTLAWLLPASNLERERSAPVGSFSGIGWAGNFDMTGNVREWTFNAVGDSRLIPGGGWNDSQDSAVPKSNPSIYAQIAMDRSPTNGFRLALLFDEAEVTKLAEGPLRAPRAADSAALEPVSDEAFAAYRSAYSYDPAPLNVAFEDRLPSSDWAREYVTFKAAYGDERMGLYLYLPLSRARPYQTVVYWPGLEAAFLDTIDDYPMLLDYLLKDGRAVAFPVLKATFQRGDRSPLPAFSTPASRELTIQEVKDVRRSLDYLETRPDIDPTKFAFFGYSWGGLNSPMVLSMEPRFKAAVLYSAGLRSRESEALPEEALKNFLPRVHQPVLVLSGAYDNVFPLETSAKPFVELLGTPEAEKRHAVYPGVHFVPRATLIRETLDWLDAHLGPTH